jgi:cellulose synthase/poly-beta-1,6-N-acetylglucosamine synthase-like glycosyltransferase
LVGCDGCTDATAAIARGACLPDAVVHEFHERRGKAAVLNRLVPLARGTIVVLCDANTLFEPGTLKLLVRHFANRDIGCVCGELRLRTAHGRPRGEALYWRYETALKFLESRFNMLVGANGAVMAVRKGLFARIPPNGIVEDFLIAMRIRAGGHRVVYDPEAVAWEEVAPKLHHEFRRRIRIGAGNFHALRYTWRMLNPAAGSIALSFWSHKVCRWLVPIALGVAQISSLSLARDPRYLVCAASLVTIDLLGFIGYQLDRRDRHWRLFSVPYYFLSMNLALFFGFIRFLRGTQTIVWSPTVRDVAPAADWVADGVRSQSAADTATTRGAGVA